MSRVSISAPCAANRGSKSVLWMAAASALAITASMIAAPAFAAEAVSSETVVGEVVVTARKVAENIQDVPVAVTAVSGETLEARGDVRVMDLASIAPGFTMREANSTPSALLITTRGQIQTDILATLDPSVGTYVDGVYWARAYGANGSMVDMSSVQILRGPQGTLFGRNTSAGAILLTTNNPELGQLSARFSVNAGNYNAVGASAVINAPLGDTVAVRLAVTGSNIDGTIHDTLIGRDYNATDSTTVRGKVLIKPNDDFSIILSAETFSYSNDGPARNLLFVRAPSSAVFAASVPYITSAANNVGNSSLNTGAFAPRSEADSETYSATVDWHVGPGDLKLIGSYRSITTLAALDLDGSPYLIHYTRGEQEISQTSWEIQYTGMAFDDHLNYVVGALYFTESGFDLSRSVNFNPAGNPAYFEGNIDNTAIGYYTQGTYALTDRLNVTAGIRYSEEEKGIVTNNGTESAATGLLTACAVNAPALDPGLPTLANRCALERNDTFDGTSYTVGFDFHLTDDVMFYAKHGTGFRSGGQNLRARGNIATAAAFLPEESTETEIGLRASFLDGRARLNLSAYDTSIEDVQRSTIVFTPSGNATILGNAAQVSIQGWEAEFDLRVTDNLTVSATAAATSPEYDEYTDLSGDRSGERFSGVAESEWSMGFAYNRPLSIGEFNLRADYSWQDSYATMEYNNPLDARNAEIIAATTAPSAGVLNARASFSFSNVELAVFGRNLGDDRSQISGLYVPGLEYISATYREPRMVGISATFSFGGN